MTDCALRPLTPLTDTFVVFDVFPQLMSFHNSYMTDCALRPLTPLHFVFDVFETGGHNFVFDVHDRLRVETADTTTLRL